MKYNICKIEIALIFFLSVFLTSCEVDPLKEVKKIEPVVNLVQTGGNGLTDITIQNVNIDKTNLLLRKPFGLAYSGLETNDGFTADLTLDYNNVPEGYEKFTSEECFITIEQDEVSSNTTLEVPAGSSNKAFYVNITQSAISSHEGKKVAVYLKLANVSYGNVGIDSTYVVIDMADFAANITDVTDTYITNTNFQRDPATTDRFAALADWISNEGLSSTRAQGAGYDANVGFLGVEKWGGGDPSIVNGKIYQTIDMEKGIYEVILEMNQVKGITDEEVNALVVAEGSPIPDDTNIASAIASQRITTTDENKEVSLDFVLDEDKEVSLGILVNVFAGGQRVLQAKQISIYKHSSLFD